MELLEVLEPRERDALRILSTQLGMKFNTLIEIVTDSNSVHQNIEGNEFERIA